MVLAVSMDSSWLPLCAVGLINTACQYGCAVSVQCSRCSFATLGCAGKLRQHYKAHAVCAVQVGWYDSTGKWDGDIKGTEVIEGERLANMMQDYWVLYPKPFVDVPLVAMLLVPLQQVRLALVS